MLSCNLYVGLIWLWPSFFSVTSDFPEEVAKLKPIMERVKVQALDRKEIVMRTEVVIESQKQPSCAKTTESKTINSYFLSIM
jgi:hypothetical protein